MISEPINSPLTEGPDSILIAASKRGEGGAFAVLVERYKATLFSVAFRITRNREDAEDVVQRSLQKALLQLHRFEAKSSFSTWLTNIATHEAYCLQKIELADPPPDDTLYRRRTTTPCF